jgi:hypothetical protein
MATLTAADEASRAGSGAGPGEHADIWVLLYPYAPAGDRVDGLWGDFRTKTPHMPALHAPKLDDGYPQLLIGWNAKRRPVYERVSRILAALRCGPMWVAFGRAVPEALHSTLMCPERCINPNHIQWGTRQQNVCDCRDKRLAKAKPRRRGGVAKQGAKTREAWNYMAPRPDEYIAINA